MTYIDLGLLFLSMFLVWIYMRYHTGLTNNWMGDVRYWVCYICWSDWAIPGLVSYCAHMLICTPRIRRLLVHLLCGHGASFPLHTGGYVFRQIRVPGKTRVLDFGIGSSFWFIALVFKGFGSLRVNDRVFCNPFVTAYFPSSHTACLHLSGCTDPLFRDDELIGSFLVDGRWRWRFVCDCGRLETNQLWGFTCAKGQF